jgi:hypothetical protein
MSHQSSHIIIKGNVTTGDQEITVDFATQEGMSDDDARKEARKWVKWVKRQYDNDYPDGD